MKWWHVLLLVAVLAFAGYAYYDLAVQGPRREVKLREDMASLTATMDEQNLDLDMQLAKAKGALASYEHIDGGRFYFTFSNPRAKWDSKERPLIEALHQCAQVDNIPNAGDWMVDGQCVVKQMR
ncbi:MAG: hypothetical protein ACLQLH_11430 [Terracidiphilus sp.]